MAVALRETRYSEAPDLDAAANTLVESSPFIFTAELELEESASAETETATGNMWTTRR